ncbi:MAG: arginine--tRNA ligase [Candidatus Levyibacteriota bacterium]
MLKQEIKKLIEKELASLGVEVLVVVDYPADPAHGDYASNVALISAKKLGKNPKEVAQEIAEKMRMKNKEWQMFEKIDIAGPGFLNFWIKYDILVASNTSLDVEMGIFHEKKIVVEYTDPNPFKELHIGHLYSNIIGESLSLLFEASGAQVRRVDYYGDVGMHVAKSLWGLLKKMKQDNVSLTDLRQQPLTDRITYLGEGYALGSNAYANDLTVVEEIKDINYLVYMSGQEYLQKKLGWQPQIDYHQYLHAENKSLYTKVKELYEAGKDWSLENFERLYKRLGTTFDNYYPESIAGERGYKIVKDNIATGIFVESEGAVIFPGEKYGLHNRVFINKLGLPTYEAKELGLAPWKYEDEPYDLSFIVTATEIAGYFGVLIEALKQVNPELGKKTKPILHGMVRLPEGKMSSRWGNVISVGWLLDEAKARVMSRMSDEILDKEAIAEMVGLAAIKYAFLKSSIGKDIVFDLEESVNFEGNSGPYLQYTYTRAKSVLDKAGKGEGGFDISRTKIKFTSDERRLLCLLARFPEIVDEAATRYAPQVLCTYLFELAQTFNLFYQKSPILKTEEDIRAFRLHLTDKTGAVLKRGLHLLGISVPDHM